MATSTPTPTSTATANLRLAIPADSQKTSSLHFSPPPAATAEDGPQDRHLNLPALRPAPTFTLSNYFGDRVQTPSPPPSPRSRSPAFSTTSTAEGGSSPLIPPLPAPTFNGRTFEALNSTPPSVSRTHRSNSSSHSQYYTASWGSPYQRPIGTSHRARSTHRHNYSGSERSEDSSVRHLEFHTPYLRPAPNFHRTRTESDFVSHDGLISAAVLANRARRPARGLTEDWIRQHTGGEAGESNNWLSDDAGYSGHSSLSGSISGGENWLAEDVDPQTPTLKRFLEIREQNRRAHLAHHRTHSSETLTQADYSELGAPSMSGEMGNVVSSGEEGTTRRNERPPPLPAKDEPSMATYLQVPTAPSPAPQPPRLKKKVPWKGKNIMVLLPWDNERGTNGKAPSPMTPKQVENMIRQWQQLGYDTTGFNLGYAENLNGEQAALGQSCNIWPLATDVMQERQQRSFNVSIPDRREWDAYVAGLQEAKLRALGVSLGDEDPPLPPPTKSKSPAILSKRNSMQYPALPFSPPLPTSSASSNLGHPQNPFSPALMGGNGLSTTQSSHPGSIASPASMHAHLQGKFNNPRHQSVSFSPGEHPFGSPFQYPPTSSPGVWSPQQSLYQQGHSRGGSPSMHNLGSIMSPTSPFGQDGYFPPGDMMGQMQQRQQYLQNQLHHQQQIQLGARSSPRLQDLREDDEIPEVESKSPSKTPEAQQIKHNPSASLQKEIDDAEYHLEEQFQRQLEHEDYSPHSEHAEKEARFAEEPVHARKPSIIQGGMGASRYAMNDSSEEGPILHHPQPHTRGHSLSQQPFQDSAEDTSSAAESKPRNRGSKVELSDVETNPSNLGTPIPSNITSASGHNKSFSNSSNPWAAPEPVAKAVAKRPGHVSKPSMLNVAAKEFTFNPSSTFSQNQFSFGGNSFQPQPTAAFNAFAPPAPAISTHISRQSVSHINATAAPFNPGKSEFSFSASGPTFRPDVPVFTPTTSNFPSDSMGSGSEGHKGSIFGNIDLSALGIKKQPKKSKAIPIVRPDSSHSDDQEEEVEGKDGRIDRSELRNKRAKGGNDDGDSVPLFAEPSMPLGETLREQSPPKESPMPMDKPADKENSAPADDSLVSPITPAKSSDQGSEEAAPFEFHEQKQAEEFNAASPFTSRRYGSGLPAYGYHAHSEDDEVSPVDEEDDMEEEEPQQTLSKGHKKSNSSLSATAKPFEFRPGAFNFTFGQPAQTATALVTPPSLPTMGLSGSKWAKSPTPPVSTGSMNDDLADDHLDSPERTDFQAALPPESPPNYSGNTFEEIDEVMRHLNEADNASAPIQSSPTWPQLSPTRGIQMPMVDSSPLRLQPNNVMRSDAPSPSPGRYTTQTGPNQAYSHDPFLDDSMQTNLPFVSPSPIHRLNRRDSAAASDWNDVLSESEEAKLQPRARFFDSHVNDLVGGLLAERLDPMERTLEGIQISLEMMAARAPSDRRDRRSVSGALSDADDEDDDNPRRSHSPRRDKKLEKMRGIVLDALNTHQSSRPATATQQLDPRNILHILEEMKEQFGQSMRLDLRGEDLRNVVEEVVERHMPAAPVRDDAAIGRESEQRARIASLEEQLKAVGSKPVFDEAAITRDAEQKARITHLEEQLRVAESKPLFDAAAAQRETDQKARISELEDRLRGSMNIAENEIANRRAAEDRLAEVQRLLRISSEEEVRLREAMDEREIKIRQIVEERDQKVRSVEDARAKTTMRIALLEAGQSNAQKAQLDLQTRINITESELQQSRQESQHWKFETERAVEAARRHNEDAEQANETNKDLRRTIDSLRTQMEESIRVRESMRGKLIALQEDISRAARDISEENSKRAKKEQELIARQEVLDAKLQAEARTRERLELEIERLEGGEREGMRAVNDLKKLEIVVAELREESHMAQKEAMRYQREFEEARESGMSEVQRTRHYMQAEIESANNQVNVVREDLENQVLRLRAEIDQVRLDADTIKEKHEMLLEEANNTKAAAIKDLVQKHSDTLEDLHAQHERQLGNAIEDAQRSEQHLLERLSLSGAKTEHLQDRVQHLEEKLEIANQAAKAAVKAARSAGVPASAAPSASARNTHEPGSRSMHLPEKISPQALRESIMVLQEQLQNREQKIEKLESALSNVDPDAATKITKRDDEIMWLRELLSVRKGDLQDIVATLSTDQYDPEQIKDAAIRLSANLQMEEQERERAMNGGSAINLPNIAASLRDAATPRVAQAVGPIAAAWGNWRKSRDPTAQHQRSGSSTPTLRNNSSSNQGFLSGLMTPPSAVAARQDLSNGIGSSRQSQPTAFGSTGQRFTNAQLANRSRGMNSHSRAVDNYGGPSETRSSPRKEMGMGIRDARAFQPTQPSTPPMMRKSSYDADARPAEDFSDAGFYDDDESENTGDGSLYSLSRR
ncbi:hypothetical protein HYFRA_00002113 [Hymenoscyphus fraxineus]|uniref:Myosin class II heavy chain n=1 Tax=Hymenoscyphus fraxineus TaxID=746836 RepID=A0A9N9KJX4_9HELO|nr:hypothetical protein HYFRA_00002113 [Hymenoscyphus fraxineus]